MTRHIDSMTEDELREWCKEAEARWTKLGIAWDKIWDAQGKLIYQIYKSDEEHE